MASISLPAKFLPSMCNVELAVNQRVHSDPFGGSEDVVDFLNDRLILSCELPESARHSEGAWREAFIGKFRGQVNTVPLYHFTRQVPRGTLRGTLVLNGAVAQGAGSLILSGGSPANGTLLMGDMLGVGGFLLMVADDCVASGGGITVPITNRVRGGLSNGAAVTSDKPTAEFRMLSNSGVVYTPRRVSSTSFRFGEKI